jgi:hypothetical protein
MNLEIEGKIIQIMPEQTGSGQRGKWIKQEFVIETSDQYPKKICFSAWGDKTDILKQLSEGESVIVSFNPESREYQNKWYTDLRAWKIIKTSGNTEDIDVPPAFNDDYLPPPEEEDLPF